MTIYRNIDSGTWDTAPAADLTADELRAIIADCGYAVAQHVGEPHGAWAVICAQGCCERYEEIPPEPVTASS